MEKKLIALVVAVLLLGLGGGYGLGYVIYQPQIHSLQSDLDAILGNQTGSFTNFEKLQFTSAYATSDSTIIFTVKNTGTAAAIIDTLLVNGQPLRGTVTYDNGKSLNPGNSTTGTITLTPAMTSGSTVEVNVQTVAGNQYPQVVILP